MNAEEAGLLPSNFEQVSNTFAKQGVSKSEKTPGTIVLRGFVKAVLPNGALVGFLGVCLDTCASRALPIILLGTSVGLFP